jgi:hypothetical protein
MGHGLKLAIILAEFGKPACDVTQYRETWPEADIQVFTGADVPGIPQFNGPRYGWRMNDFYKVRKMLDSGADVAMCFDGDMRIVDREAARGLPLLAQKFGICLPMNPRYTVKRDFTDGADVSGCTDQTMWHGPSVNCSPIAINLTGGSGPLTLAKEYCRLMLAHPQRGPMAWWHAMLNTGVAPLILPPQWCVCERHIGVGGEIILHEGHDAVKRHYAAHRAS